MTHIIHEHTPRHTQRSAVGGLVPLFNPRILLLLALIAIAITVFAYLIPTFLTVNSFTSILRQWSVLLIVSLGATFIIVSGEIDLSVGSVVAFVSVLAAWASKTDYGIAGMILAAVAVGIGGGSINALLCLKLRVPSFLATLGMLLVIKGIAMTVSLQPMAVRDLDFVRFFRASPLGLPMPFVLALIVFAGSYILLDRTRFGIWTRAVGSNLDSARLSGIPILRHKYLIFILGSTMAAIGGLVLAGRTNYGIAQSATGLELDVIAAVVLGGGRLGGGDGSIVGTALGAFLLTLLFTGIAVLGLPGPYQDIMKGVMIGVAILLMRK